MNCVILIGKAVKVQELNGSTPCVKIQIELTETYGGKTYTSKQTVAAWGKSAEGARGIQAGETIAVQGSLKTSSYTDKTTGEKRFSTEVNASKIEKIGAAIETIPYVAVSVPYDTPVEDIPF